MTPHSAVFLSDAYITNPCTATSSQFLPAPFVPEPAVDLGTEHIASQLCGLDVSSAACTVQAYTHLRHILCSIQLRTCTRT